VTNKNGCEGPQRRARGSQPWEADMADAVTTKDIRAVIADPVIRNPSQPSSMAPRPRSSEPDPKSVGTGGWYDAAPLTPRPGLWAEETEDEKRARVAAQQAAELQEIEARISRRSQHKATTEYNPFSRQRMGHDD
jgi:hypothetical protein